MVDLKKITILTSKTDANAYIEGVKEDDPYINIVDGQFEKRFQQLFEKCLPEKSISFDIGANIGIISVILGTIRPEGRVFSFEGGQHVCEVLRRNVARNLLKNVNVSHCAIANYNGVIHFNENSAYGHAVDGIDENAEADQAGMTSVPCFTVDELVARHSIERLDLIKLDIEGFEPQALAGAVNTIRKFDPIILMEINPWCIENYGKVDFRTFMKEIFEKYKTVYIVNKNWSEENPIVEISFDELFRKIESSENLFVDDLILSNRSILREAANT